MTPVRTAGAVIVVVALALIAVSTASAQSPQSVGGVVGGRLEASIDQVSSRIVRGWLELAQARQAKLFVLELNTPGGRFDSTREMVGAILESPVPVAVFVSPAGARAASAGTFIVAAGHIAAMAPGTNVGAASPVTSTGDDLPDTLKAKATQDAAALLRGIATERGRNSEALERTIFEAASYSAAEAIDLDIVDLMANGVVDLLSKIDGQTVSVGGADRVLKVSGSPIEWIEPTRVQKFIDWIADPQLVYIMLAVGGILVFIEFMSPGGWIPGVAGAGLLIMAFLGLGNLPVNWVGVVLIIAGLALVFVELQAPGWGGFGIAGGIAFVVGGFLLFGDTSVPGLPAPDVRVGWAVLAGTAAFLAVGIIGLIYFKRESRNIHFESRESMIVGQIGVVRTPLQPRGTVHVDGELWTAESESGEAIDSGENVVVAELDGVTLKVFRASSLDALERSIT